MYCWYEYGYDLLLMFGFYDNPKSSKMWLYIYVNTTNACF